MVEQLPEHELAYGSEPAWERGEGEAVAEEQPPRVPFLARQMSRWFYDTSTGTAQSSPLWFLDGEGLGLSSSSYGQSTVDTVVYIVHAIGA